MGGALRLPLGNQHDQAPLLHTCTLTHTAWGASRRSWRCHEVADTAGVLDTGSEGTTGQGGKEGESPFM